MSERLMRIDRFAAEQIRAETFDNFENIVRGGLEAHTEPTERVVRLREARTILDDAMDRFQRRDVKSDAWLAPRFHATLRLTRREASDRGIWDYLSAIAFPDYVQWRWGDEEGNIDEDRIQITSRNREIRHALFRLWWGAELTRSGSDYGPVEELFAKQETLNWFTIDALRNRAAAQAFICYLSELQEGEWATDKQIRKLASAMNHALVTTVLDSLAPDRGPDLLAVEEWIAQEADASLMFTELPEGPNDPIDPEHIAAVLSFLEKIWTQISTPTPA